MNLKSLKKEKKGFVMSNTMAMILAVFLLLLVVFFILRVDILKWIRGIPAPVAPEDKEIDLTPYQLVNAGICQGGNVVGKVMSTSDITQTYFWLYIFKSLNSKEFFYPPLYILDNELDFIKGDVPFFPDWIRNVVVGKRVKVGVIENDIIQLDSPSELAKLRAKYSNQGFPSEDALLKINNAKIIPGNFVCLAKTNS